MRENIRPRSNGPWEPHYHLHLDGSVDPINTPAGSGLAIGSDWKEQQ